MTLQVLFGLLLNTGYRINVPTRPEMRKGTQAARQRKYASDLKDVHEEILDKSKREAFWELPVSF